MSETERIIAGIRTAQLILERAMVAGDLEEMKVLGIQAANSILDMQRPVAVQRAYCANPTCGRLITEHDPIFAGHCSTMCRESFHSRVLRSVHAKFTDDRSMIAFSSEARS